MNKTIMEHKEKMQNKNVLSFLALGIIGLLVIGGVSAYGFGFGRDNEFSEEQREDMHSNQQAIRQSIEDNDYAAWEALMQERLAMNEERLAQMEDKINEQGFQEMAERHANMQEFRQAVEELKESGDFSKQALKELAEEYGVEAKGMKNGMKSGFMKGVKQGYRLGHNSRQQGECPYANAN